MSVNKKPLIKTNKCIPFGIWLPVKIFIVKTTIKFPGQHYTKTRIDVI